jgi:putative membrane protein
MKVLRKRHKTFNPTPMKIQPKGGAKALFIVALILCLASCSGKKSDDSKAVAEEHNDAKFDKAEEKDAQFLVDASSINMEEIRLGELAQKNGTLADVKQLGKEMVNDHTKALAAVKELASKKSVTLPTDLPQDAEDSYKKLVDKRGADFDKEYCDMMVDGHKKAVDKFEKAAADGKDSDIRTWASSMLPSLRAHLDHAMVCQENCKKVDSKRKK